MPPKELREAVESLRSLAPRLNKITDEANEIVRSVEQFLNEECSVGISAHFRYKDFEGTTDGGVFLEYRRVGQKYRIAIVEADDNYRDTSVKPWADSSRQDKLESFPYLPELLRHIAEKVSEQVQKVEVAARDVVDTLGVFRQPVPSRPTPPSAPPSPPKPSSYPPSRPAPPQKSSGDEIPF